MKILRIFSVVVGIHVFALVLIFANPGCSSPNKPAPSPSDTLSNSDDASNTPVSRAGSDNVSPVVIAGDDSAASSVPSSFDPNASATPEIRFSPTRPGTPAASTLEAQPVGDVTPATTYTVAKGDSLWTIAKKHGVSIAEIAAANNIRPNATIRLGQKLIVPAKTVSSNPGVMEPAMQSPATPTRAPAPSSSGSLVKHVVRSGETLGAIARKYQVKVGEIATANNISDPAKIRQGMELVIPGWQAPRGQSKSASVPAAEPATPPPSSDPVPATSTPSLIIPAPESETTTQPPVIRVQ
jgi:LysM repeat protein